MACASRADSIVEDAERVRRNLVPMDSCGGRMAILGQSFGGFCCLTYLSAAPQGARLASFAWLMPLRLPSAKGGLHAPQLTTPVELFHLSSSRILHRNKHANSIWH